MCGQESLFQIHCYGGHVTATQCLNESRKRQGRPGPPWLSDASSPDPDKNRIQRLACRHGQAVAFGAAKTDIGTDLRQSNHTYAVTIRSYDLYAGSGAGPDIAIDITADTVGTGATAVDGIDQLGEGTPIAQPVTVYIPHTNVSPGTGVCHEQQ